MIRAFEAPHCLAPALLRDDLWQRTDLVVARARPHSTSGGVLLVTDGAAGGRCLAVLKRRRHVEAQREELVSHLSLIHI